MLKSLEEERVTVEVKEVQGDMEEAMEALVEGTEALGLLEAEKPVVWVAEPEAAVRFYNSIRFHFPINISSSGISALFQHQHIFKLHSYIVQNEELCRTYY